MICPECRKEWHDLLNRQCPNCGYMMAIHTFNQVRELKKRAIEKESIKNRIKKLEKITYALCETEVRQKELPTLHCEECGGYYKKSESGCPYCRLVKYLSENNPWSNSKA